jgi:predicted RNA binding protein YcfA (HicA-like mRNA interferase family)
MNRRAFIRMLELNGVFFDHHGSKHDIYRHKRTGKMIPVPRHSEFSNEFLKDVLKEIPRDK